MHPRVKEGGMTLYLQVWEANHPLLIDGEPKKAKNGETMLDKVVVLDNPLPVRSTFGVAKSVTDSDAEEQSTAPPSDL